MATARYIGGPLDGQEATHTGGRWPAYRDDNGHHLPVGQGDREFCTFAGRPLRRHYAHQTDRDGQHVYVHATVFDAWNTQAP